MRLDWRTLLAYGALFALLVLAFLGFGARVGWRVFGVLVLVSGVQSLREGRFGIGIEGREPYYLTGRVAALMSAVLIGGGLVLLLFPEVFLR